MMKIKSAVITRVGNKLSMPREGIRDKFYIFLICLAIAVLMWFMVILARESVSTLDYHIKFSNMPEGMALINQPDSIVSMRIAKGGLELFILKYFTGRKHLEIDLSQLNLIPQDDFLTATFPTAALLEILQKRYFFSEELISVNPDKIFFRFEPLAIRVVPVIPKLNLTFQRLYKQKGTSKISPDSVKVVAPQNVLDSIHFVETQPVTLKDIAGEITYEAEVTTTILGQHVHVYPKSVIISIHAEKFTEMTIELPVEHDPGEFDLKTFPDKVTVTYHVAISDYSRIDAGMFRAIADLSEGTLNNRAPVKLVAFPSFIEVVKTDPSEVEYLLLGYD